MFLILVFSAGILFSEQDKNGGIIYGKDWAYTILAPKGWIWDSKTLAKQGIWGLFYSAETKFSPTTLHMYINPVSVAKDVSLEEFIKEDISNFKRQNKSIDYVFENEYLSKDKKSLKIYRLDDEQKKYFQYIGFAKYNKTIFIFVLSARSADERMKNKVAYEQLFDTFLYMDRK
jgi:hypothetical protein